MKIDKVSKKGGEKMNNEIGEDKKEEIIKACEELYKETSLKEITI